MPVVLIFFGIETASTLSLYISFVRIARCRHDAYEKSIASCP